jgi:hypothetical protein
MSFSSKLSKKEMLFFLKDFSSNVQSKTFSNSYFPVDFSNNVVIKAIRSGAVPVVLQSLVQLVLYAYMLKECLPSFRLKDLIEVLFKATYPKDSYRRNRKRCIGIFIAVQEANLKLDVQGINKSKGDLRIIIDRFNIDFKEALHKRGFDYL